VASLIVSAVAKWNGTALKRGQKDLTSFQKTTLSLAKTFATVFAAQKIYAFGKASVKAFAEDEKAAKSLEIALKNTGNGFATIATEGFISRMQQTYRVLDDELRPAFQTLLTSTGSVTKAQEGLQLALDVSAGTTKDLAAVSAALARGYAGNTQGLSRLNAGLSKAILKTGDMEKITAALTSRFQGQAIGALDTYTKKMEALSIAAANSKEIIGKGLLDSIAALGGNDGITNAADAMETLAQNTADTIYGFSLLIAKAKELGGINLGPNTGKFGGLVASTLAGAGVGAIAGGGVGAVPGAFIGLTAGLSAQRLAESGRSARESKTPYTGTSMYFTAQTAARALETATIKKGIDLRKKENQSKAQELADKKKQAELDALKKNFDVDRINLETALLNSKDDAEKARIRSLLTIMDEDENAASRRLAELDTANKKKMDAEYLAAISLGNLAEAAKLAAMGVSGLTIGGVPAHLFSQVAADPARSEALATAVLIEAEAALAAAEAALKRSTDAAEGDAAAMALLNPPTNYGYTAENPSFTYSPPINITFNDAIGTQEYFTESVKRAFQQLNRYGDSTTYAGAIG
jgi:uncharacterized protein YcfJ